MIAPKLENGDLVIENNELVFVEGDEELIQSIRATMTMRKGEFFLEEEAGMVYDNILGRHTNKAEARDDIIEAVSQEERVRAIREIDFVDETAARKRTIYLTIEGSNGEEISVEAGAIGEGVN